MKKRYRPVIEITAENLNRIKEEAQAKGMTERRFLSLVFSAGYEVICNN